MTRGVFLQEDSLIILTSIASLVVFFAVMDILNAYRQVDALKRELAEKNAARMHFKKKKTKIMLFSLFSDLPKDLKHYFIVEWLDGPTACALISTCKACNELVSLKERLWLRLRERDSEYYIRKKRAHIQFCNRCLNPLNTHCHCRFNYLKKPNYSICKGCSQKGPYKAYQPWLLCGSVFRLECVSCKCEFLTRPTSSDNVWLASESCCLRDDCSGILCNECSPLVFKCDRCEAFVATFDEKEHCCGAFLSPTSSEKRMTLEEEKKKMQTYHRMYTLNEDRRRRRGYQRRLKMYRPRKEEGSSWWNYFF